MNFCNAKCNKICLRLTATAGLWEPLLGGLLLLLSELGGLRQVAGTQAWGCWALVGKGRRRCTRRLRAKSGAPLWLRVLFALSAGKLRATGPLTGSEPQTLPFAPCHPPGAPCPGSGHRHPARSLEKCLSAHKHVGLPAGPGGKHGVECSFQTLSFHIKRTL